MRIRTVGVLAVFGLALLASGCGGDKPSTTPTAKAGGKLVIWADDKRAEVLKSFKNKFEKDNGVTVDVQAISKDQQTTFVTASQQGSGPDVMVGAHDWIGNLVQNGSRYFFFSSTRKRAAAGQRLVTHNRERKDVPGCGRLSHFDLLGRHVPQRSPGTRGAIAGKMSSAYTSWQTGAQTAWEPPCPVSAPCP